MVKQFSITCKVQLLYSRSPNAIMILKLVIENKKYQNHDILKHYILFNFNMNIKNIIESNNTFREVFVNTRIGPQDTYSRSCGLSISDAMM